MRGGGTSCQLKRADEVTRKPWWQRAAVFGSAADLEVWLWTLRGCLSSSFQNVTSYPCTKSWIVVHTRWLKGYRVGRLALYLFVRERTTKRKIAICVFTKCLLPYNKKIQFIYIIVPTLALIIKFKKKITNFSALRLAATTDCQCRLIQLSIALIS